MIVLQKNENKDFVVLNLTDIQLDNAEWEQGTRAREIIEHTVKTLIEKVKPDLITISGDLAWAGNYQAYDSLAAFLAQFEIPWAPIWGNHDNQLGAECIDKVANAYLSAPYCIYEKGDSSLGNGNYIICIKENEKIVQAIFMMDSHDRLPYIHNNGEETLEWAKLNQAQIEWYKTQAKALKAQGCTDSTLVVHIPIYAYSLASAAAYKDGVALGELTVAQSYENDCWKDGYQDSVGVQHEKVSCYPADDGVFAALKEEGFTKHVVAGHDHVNNWIIRYDGVKLIYGLKTGEGCYWDSILNGGTVLKINKNGVYDVYHEYVDVADIIKKHA